MALGEFDAGTVLRALGEVTANPGPLVRRMGLLVAVRARLAFQEQKRGPVAWKERVTPNLPGILADLRKGSTPPERRFQPRPAGVDTGRLMNDVASSEAVRPDGRDAVKVGSRLPYASLIQFGGDVDIPIDDGLKERIGAYLRTLTRRAARAQTKALTEPILGSGNFAGADRVSARAKQMQALLGPLMRPAVRGITWHVVPRPYVMVTDDDLEDFRSLIFDHLFKRAA